MRTRWAVVEVDDGPLQVPYYLTRFRWYARLLRWYLLDSDEDGTALVVMPWTVQTTGRR